MSSASDRGTRRTKKKVDRTSKVGDRERGFGASERGEEVEWPLAPPSNHVWQAFLAQTDLRRQQVQNPPSFDPMVCPFNHHQRMVQSW